MMSIHTIAFANVPRNLPNPHNDFFKYMTTWSRTQNAAVYDPSAFGITASKSLKDNIRDMFYPGVIGTNKLRPILQTIAWVIFFIFLIVIGSTFLIDADNDDKIRKAQTSFLYLMYGGFLVFWSMRILRQLGVETGSWTTLIMNLRDRVIFNFISFIKAGAFFVAIVLIIYHGLQIIRAYEKEDKLAEARKAIINILWVLVLIRVVDYVYFIAYAPDFQQRAVDLIIQVSRLFGWLIGLIAVLYLIYAGVMLATGQWESDKFKKATSIIKWIIFAIFIIFLFLLTMYQLFKDLG